MGPQPHSLVLLDTCKLLSELVDLMFLINAVPNEADKHQAYRCKCHVSFLLMFTSHFHFQASQWIIAKPLASFAQLGIPFGSDGIVMADFAA